METVQSYRNACMNLQSQLIKNQETLINVQKELSECKSEKLESLEKVVKSSVANSVKDARDCLSANQNCRSNHTKLSQKPNVVES